MPTKTQLSPLIINSTCYSVIYKIDRSALHKKESNKVLNSRTQEYLHKNNRLTQIGLFLKLQTVVETLMLGGMFSRELIRVQ